MHGRLRRHAAGAVPGAGVGVEVTGRFVGEDHFGACKQGAHDGDALLLTAGAVRGGGRGGFRPEGLDQVVAPLQVRLLPGDQGQVNSSGPR